jgi:hypothetical protein
MESLLKSEKPGEGEDTGGRRYGRAKIREGEAPAEPCDPPSRPEPRSPVSKQIERQTFAARSFNVHVVDYFVFNCSYLTLYLS